MAFDKFTLADIKYSVRKKLDDDGFDGDTITEAANDFQFELFNDNRIRFMEKSTVLSIASGSTSKTLPSDFMNMLNFVVYDSDTQYRNITADGYVEYNDFMVQYQNFAIADASKIWNWTMFGDGIRFSAPTDATYSALLDYMRSPQIMVNDEDESELPINARELMTLGTLERVMRVNEDYNEAGEESDRLISLRTAFIRNYGRGSLKVGPRVIRTNRNRGGAGGYRADRDF